MSRFVLLRRHQNPQRTLKHNADLKFVSNAINLMTTDFAAHCAPAVASADGAQIQTIIARKEDGEHMNIYWHKDNQELVTSLYDQQAVSQYNWFLRDVIPVSLYVVRKNTGSINVPFAVTDIATGESIRFGAKAAYDDTSFLFSQASWTGSGSGATRKYSAEISLNTSALIAAMAAVDELTVKGEFTIIQDDNSNALTTQFDIKVTRDVIIGTEGVPTTEFNVIEQFTDSDGIKKVRLVNADGITCFVGTPL